MLAEFVLIMLFSFVPACLSYFLDYCLGLPGSEDKISPKQIFFGYTLRLARRRLKQKGMLKGLESNFHAMLNEDNPRVRADGLKLMKITTVIEGRKFFTWEFVFGMCILCTGFWIAELTAVASLFFLPLHYWDHSIMFLLLPIFSHIILRKL